MKKILVKIKNRLKYFVRIFNYHFLDEYIDLLKYFNTDFSIENSLGEVLGGVTIGINGKKYKMIT